MKLAVVVLLEKLSPTQRAAYVLREAFDYSYRQIADILQIEEANSRRLVSRARKYIADGRRTPASPSEQRRFLEAFIGVAQKGDLVALEGLFAEYVVSYSDGGGLVRAARVPVVGRERVAKFIAAFPSHFWKDVTLAWVEASGQESVLISRNGDRDPLLRRAAERGRTFTDEAGLRHRGTCVSQAHQESHSVQTLNEFGLGRTLSHRG